MARGIYQHGRAQTDTQASLHTWTTYPVRCRSSSQMKEMMAENTSDTDVAKPFKMLSAYLITAATIRPPRPCEEQAHKRKTTCQCTHRTKSKNQCDSIKIENRHTHTAYRILLASEMFASPAKNRAQCTDVQSKLHSIWEQNDFKTNLLQL